MDLSVTTLGTVLGVWAHPDDEAYLMGGLMALAADAGQHVACLTATLGDAGETADEQRWPRGELARIRRAEVARSLALLGVDDHHCLDLPDGGLAAIDPSEPVAAIADHVALIGPDTVITFGPDGMTGHDDHRTVSGWTAAALDRCGSACRLLWATKTRSWAAAFAHENEQVFPPGLPPVADHDRCWNLELDDPTLARKVAALEAHASQTTSLITAFGRDRYAAWVRLEAFAPAWSAGQPDRDPVPGSRPR